MDPGQDPTAGLFSGLIIAGTVDNQLGIGKSFQHSFAHCQKY